MFHVATVTAAILFSAALAVSQPECNLRENAWCENLDNAKTCGAFSYCLSSVWPRINKEDLPCHEGQDFVKQFQQELMDRQRGVAEWTQFGKLCSALDGKLQDTCHATLVENQEEVIRLLNSTVRPSTIARILNLCRGHPTPQREKLCTDCKAFMADIEKMVIGPGIEEKLRKKMESFCHQAPHTMLQLCLNLTDDWIKHFFEFLNEELSFNRVCYAASFCTEETLTFPKKTLLSGQRDITDFTCRPCQNALNQVRSALQNPKFQEEVDEVFEATFCSMLPRYMVKGCKEQVKRFSGFAFDFLVMEMDSVTMCRALRLCPAPSDGAKSSDKVFYKMSSLIHTASKTLMPLLNPFAATVSKYSSECAMCQFFMKEITRILSQQHSKDQIISVFDRLCETLPEPWSKQCTNFVDNNGGDIIDSIIHSLSPKEMCQTIGFCEVVERKTKRDASPQLLVQMQHQNDVPSRHTPEEPLKESYWCDICHRIAGIVHRVLGSQQLYVAVDFVQHSVCSLLPRGLGTKCTGIYRQAAGAFLSGISTVIEPKLVCGSIGVCRYQLIPMNYNVTLPNVLRVKDNE